MTTGRACLTEWTVKANMAVEEADRLPDEQIVGQIKCVVPQVISLPN